MGRGKTVPELGEGKVGRREERVGPLGGVAEDLGHDVFPEILRAMVVRSGQERVCKADFLNARGERRERLVEMATSGCTDNSCN